MSWWSILEFVGLIIWWSGMFWLNSRQAENRAKRRALWRVREALERIQYNKVVTMDDVLLAVLDAVMDHPEETLIKQKRNLKAHPGRDDD